MSRYSTSTKSVDCDTVASLTMGRIGGLSLDVKSEDPQFRWRIVVPSRGG